MLAILLLIVSIAAFAAGPGVPRVDQTKAYAYGLPEGWTSGAVNGLDHDVLRAGTADNARNIVVSDQPGSAPFDELRQKYERDLSRALKGFKLIRSGLIDLGGGRMAVRIVQTNTIPGHTVRQVDTILEVAGRRYFVACTARESEGEAHDKEFDQFIKSMRVAP